MSALGDAALAADEALRDHREQCTECQRGPLCGDATDLFEAARRSFRALDEAAQAAIAALEIPDTTRRIIADADEWLFPTTI